jgi:pimeloyl-ACP methyl ester carboxylesterase
VLPMVGTLDIITSPARARAIAAPFSKGRVVEVPHGGHLLVGQPGEDERVLRIEGDFIEKGSAQRLDTARATGDPRKLWAA